MHLLSLPVAELLSIWSDLDDAYHGKNGYGGDTAEIYAYRLWNYEPLLDFHGGYVKGSDGRAAEENARHQAAVDSLLAILKLFASKRQCEIEIDGEPMSKWHKSNWEFKHRAHIRITSSVASQPAS